MSRSTFSGSGKYSGHILEYVEDLGWDNLKYTIT